MSIKKSNEAGKVENGRVLHTASLWIHCKIKVVNRSSNRKQDSEMVRKMEKRMTRHRLPFKGESLLQKRSKENYVTFQQTEENWRDLFI